MRFVFGAWAFAMVLTGVATAQEVESPATEAEIAAAPASRCGPFPDPPALPLRGRRTEAQMNAGNQALARWANELQAAHACREAERNDLRAQYRSIQAQVAARVREQSAVNERLAQVDAQWSAAVAEFNRSGR